MGAWIEIRWKPFLCPAVSVAPHVGAWIEISLTYGEATKFASHPTWVRGLKFVYLYVCVQVCRSHPTWVRGLKFVYLYVCVQVCKSHPTWVRGLKCILRPILARSAPVAPHVGAWIEISKF